ncbi:MAG TPA: recombinase XerD, partial [Bacteroidetes bacterium]|nr:recombinase XerD [Bacteroidota bacterium]
MMKNPIIFEAPNNAKRIKIYIPYEMKETREKFKKLNSTFWHPEQKLWSIINTKENIEMVKKIFKKEFEVKPFNKPIPIKHRTLNNKSLDIIFKLEKTLHIKHYSRSTVKIYKSMLSVFLANFQNQDIENIKKEQIENFIYRLIKENNISSSYQNQMINAIKAYYEQVLGKPREIYNIKRPKKEKHIPGVLSAQEVFKIINHPTNLKHKTILTTIYSAGLRITEAINLRIDDIHSEEGYIFVRDSKGKKDRKTILSPYLLKLLRQYYIKYKPGYWLFEGQTGGQYSVTSIRKIFRKAVKQTGSNPWSTVHTLRHSFATHCIENNVNL